MGAQEYFVPGQAKGLFGMQKHRFKSYELSLTWESNVKYY